MTVIAARYVLDCNRCRTDPVVSPPESSITPRGIRLRAWKHGWLSVGLDTPTDPPLDYCPACVAECGLPALSSGTAPPFAARPDPAPAKSPRRATVSVYLILRDGELIESDGAPIYFADEGVANRLSSSLTQTGDGARYTVEPISVETTR